MKTIFSVCLIAILYSLIDRNPCFACIGAVFGMGNMLSSGLHSGGNRFIGTFIGGLLAIPFYQLYHHPPLPFLPSWVYLGVGLFCVLYISQIFSVNDAIQPGTVVFFVVILTVPETTYLLYTFNRVIDTGVGVAFSLFINHLHRSPLDLLEKNLHS